MDFNVPRGNSNIFHIEVFPERPENDTAKVWRMVNTTISPVADVDALDIIFSATSTPAERCIESGILVFSIAESVQTADVSWRFSQDGLVYCHEKADFLGDMQFSLSNNRKTLTCTVQCLTDIPEVFNFSFVALTLDNTSGQCEIFASADPGGTISRN